MTVQELTRRRNDAVANEETLALVEKIIDRKGLEAHMKHCLESLQAQATKPSRTATGFERFSECLQRFLDAHSAIGDICRAIHPQIGGLIYGTLMLVVTLASHKYRYQQLISKHLDHMMERLLPLQELIQYQVPDQRLYAAVESAETLVIVFALNIYKDCDQTWLVQLWRELKGTSSGRIKATVDKFDREVGQAQHHLQRLRDDKYDRMAKQIEAADMERDESRKRQLQDARETLKSQLQCESGLLLPQQRDDISRLWDLNCAHETDFRTMERSTLQTFQKEPTCSKWLHSSTNRLLILTMVNDANMGGFEQSWISPGLVELALSLQEPGQQVIFYSTQKSDHPAKVVATIIYELIKLLPDTEALALTKRCSKMIDIGPNFPRQQLNFDNFPAALSLLTYALKQYRRSAQSSLYCFIDRFDRTWEHSQTAATGANADRSPCGGRQPSNNMDDPYGTVLKSFVFTIMEALRLPLSSTFAPPSLSTASMPQSSAEPSTGLGSDSASTTPSKTYPTIKFCITAETFKVPQYLDWKNMGAEADQRLLLTKLGWRQWSW